MDAASLVQLVTRQPRARCRIVGGYFGRSVDSKQALGSRRDSIVGDRPILMGRVIAGSIEVELDLSKDISADPRRC
jgi:hypothetical protein